MTTARLILQGFRAMQRYKLRTAFMMLGSIVGVAALTLTMSVGGSARAKMVRTLRQILGDESIVVIGGGSRMLGSPRAGAARLTLDDVAAVAKEVDDIRLWDPQADLRLPVRYGDAGTTARVVGQSERWERVWARGVSSGESFDAAAVVGSARVAIIGETVARRLFPGQDPLDADIRIGSVPFRIVGVLERFGNDMHGMDRDNEIVVPITTLMRRLSNADAIGAARFIVKDPNRQGRTAGEIARVLRVRHALGRDEPDDFRIITSLEARQMMAMIERILMLYIPLAGGIVLLVGGVVAAALMLASVTERTAEIGVRRAVGALPRDIQTQFLIETTTVVVVGALGGVALGYFGAELIASRMRLDGGFSWAALLVGITSSAVVGLLAGIAPARRAARLAPADALR